MHVSIYKLYIDVCTSVSTYMYIDVHIYINYIYARQYRRTCIYKLYIIYIYMYASQYLDVHVYIPACTKRAICNSSGTQLSGIPLTH